MNPGGVSLNDYQEGASFGAPFAGTENEISTGDLVKALSAGNGGSGGSMANQAAGAGNLQPAITESLEAKLKYLTLQRTELKLWNMVKTSPAFALSEEFLQLTDIGAERGGFHDEFDLPEQSDASYARKSEQVKYLGVTKAVSHQSQLVRTNLGSIVNREIDNGTLWILRRLNKALAFGNANIVPSEFNGIYAQHGYVGANQLYPTLDAYYSADVVIDLRGKSLKQENFFDGAETIDENHGFADTIFGPNSVIVDLAKDYIEKQRILLGTSNTQTFGTTPKAITTPHGDINLQIDKFLKSATPRKTSEAANGSKAPANPVPHATTPQTAAVDTTTKFGMDDDGDGLGDGAGDYFYGVSAINKYGESQVVSMGVKLTVAATNAVTLTFAAGAGVNAATGFIIYRSKKNPATAIADTDLYPIFAISAGELSTGYDGAAPGSVKDKNRRIAGTEQAFMWQSGDEVFEFKQLAPLMKMDLAQLDPTMRFMLLMYGTPQLYAPKKIVRFVNIGAFR